MTSNKHVRARTLLTTITAAATVVALAACSGPAPADSGGGPGAEGFEGQTLHVASSVQLEVAINYVADEFEKETGAEVEVTIVSEAAPHFFLDQVSGAAEIDAVIFNYPYLGEFVEAGILLDLTDYIDEHEEEIDPSDFFSSLYDASGLYDGRRYGLPIGGAATSLFYNKEILARNGFDTPATTWNEYQEQVETITANESANGVYGASIYGTNLWYTAPTAFAHRFAGFGGEYEDEDGTYHINSPEAVQAVKALADTAPYAIPTVTQTALPEGYRDFLSGNVAYFEAWLSSHSTFSSTAGDSAISDIWGVTTLPLGSEGDEPRQALNVGNILGASAKTDTPELASAFIAFATGKETAKGISELPGGGGADLTRQSTLDFVGFEESRPDLYEVYSLAEQPNALWWPNAPGSLEAIQALADRLTKILADGVTDEATIQKELDAVQVEWDRIFND